MFSANSRLQKLLLATAVSAISLIPLGAQAQSLPSYASPATREETIRGTISSFDGQYSMRVHDDRGFLDNVLLHQGTVINPTGLRLQPGMRVAITGYNNGPTLAANVINTPYPPSYVYYQNGPYYYGWGGYWGGWGGYWGGWYRPYGWGYWR
jgi:hypothetical protein